MHKSTLLNILKITQSHPPEITIKINFLNVISLTTHWICCFLLKTVMAVITVIVTSGNQSSEDVDDFIMVINELVARSGTGSLLSVSPGASPNSLLCPVPWSSGSQCVVLWPEHQGSLGTCWKYRLSCPLPWSQNFYLISPLKGSDDTLESRRCFVLGWCLSSGLVPFRKQEMRTHFSHCYSSAVLFPAVLCWLCPETAIWLMSVSCAWFWALCCLARLCRVWPSPVHPGSHTVLD